MKLARVALLIGIAGAGGCSEGLGDCDMEQATTLVFGRNDLVATAGQALTHDSCGNGAFCHSSSARGANRVGTPKGLDFDMIPTARGWSRLRGVRQDAWDEVKSGSMPPGAAGHDKLGDNDWAFDPGRGSAALRLPSIRADEGKEIFRNWLACQAPTVNDTQLMLPSTAMDAPSEDAGPEKGIDFAQLFDEVLEPSCVPGCHDARGAAGGLSMGDPCSARAALLETGGCQHPRVVPGDADGSLLIEKLTQTEPSCLGPMPPTAPLADADIARVRAWIDEGALAPGCD